MAEIIGDVLRECSALFEAVLPIERHRRDKGFGAACFQAQAGVAARFGYGEQVLEHGFASAPSAPFGSGAHGFEFAVRGVEVLDGADGGKRAVCAGGVERDSGLAQLFKREGVNFVRRAFGVHAGEMERDEGAHIVRRKVVFRDAQSFDHGGPGLSWRLVLAS